MDSVRLRPWQAEDEAEILRLNAEFVSVLSPMDATRFQNLREQCCLLQVAEANHQVAGFLIGFGEGAAYDSVNYRWFSARLKQFLYIDRIVINKDFQRVGLGRRFYKEAERWAIARDRLWLAAEVDIEPPNPASLKFHRQLGFVEVARQGTGNKQVSLQVRSIA